MFSSLVTCLMNVIWHSPDKRPLICPPSSSMVQEAILDKWFHFGVPRTIKLWRYRHVEILVAIDRFVRWIIDDAKRRRPRTAPTRPVALSPFSGPYRGQTF